MKRLQTDIVDDDYNNKRRKVINLSEKSITHFGDLSNDIIYEIFEFIDFSYISRAFSNLNQRFQNLLTDSKLPIQINISSISKSKFQRYYTNVIIPYVHRIKSLRISNLFIVNIILSSFDNVSKFTRLETLILDNIELSYISNLHYLINLPRLHSLVIIDKASIQNKVDLYYQIFQLPTLKYCKVSFGENYFPVRLLPFATNKFSSIEHLVINHSVHLEQLYVILSYVSQLHRLSIHDLYNTNEKIRDPCPLVLDYLTNITLQFESITFENFKVLVKDLFYNVKVLCISTSRDITYLDADQWQQLILSHMPNLNIFDIHYIYSINNIDNDISMYNVLVKKFTSSFWIERQWFFATQYPCGRYQNNIIFYSTKPYRRNNFTLYGIIKEKNNFNSIHHLQIKSVKAMINCTNYFSNTTKVTFTDNFDVICDSIGRSLKRIVSVQHITTLIIDYPFFSFMQLMKLLTFTVNIHTLKLPPLSVSDIDFNTIRQNVTFHFISIANTIKNLILKERYSLEQIELLTALCPRLQHLAVNGFETTLIPIIRLLLSKNNNNTRHLSSLYVLEMDEALGGKMKLVIETEKLLDDFLIKFINRKVYLWW